MEDVFYDRANSYHSFTIKARRSAKIRTIDAPNPPLKLLQRATLDKLLAPVVAHDASMAFAPGKSIAMNARRHLGASYLFSTDIRSFFPSVTSQHVREMLEARFQHFSPEAREEVQDLVTFNGRLPQGAPTSPHIGNLVMFSFDEICCAKAAEMGAVYTRYADDISVSSNSSEPPQRMQEVITGYLSAMGMELHPDKTRQLGPKQTRIVTGLDIGRSRLRPTKAYRKKAAALVRMSSKYPTKMARQHYKILGYLAYWNDIDPSDPQLAALLDQMKRPSWAAKVRASAARQKPRGQAMFHRFPEELLKDLGPGLRK
ncbi:reverse transcriptase family protein [Lutimaribacter saemankumensis]|uniref:RNA-directed DNA polymerase n=1 Tax=Lutimaribacter saemankumensis TaxID=490829 RepID=A0A1G8TCQ0_9RHOB|nr:reverse transcriptase family protein [Lutimaribacter saemankumensis]SDJ39382.1 Reverse transcriptase (RNA-dependent DNA polymerase) [Lutimaribacter saemankumensis]